MRIHAVDPVTPDRALLARAAALLQRGQLVAFPTETVYGLGANATDPEAVQRIYDAKGRPAINPLIVHVLDAASAKRLVTQWPEAAEKLTARWWPGPLTIVLPKAREIPQEVTAGLTTVALRVPAHPVALGLLKACGFPLAAPSANRSGELSPTTAQHVEQSLGDRVPMILDAGPTAVGIESTVVDLSDRVPTLLRPGMITREELEAVVGPIQVAASAALGDTPRPAPGMLDRHYAPRARVVLFSTLAEAQPAAAAARSQGGTIGALVRTLQVNGVDTTEQLPAEPAGYARELYGALHRLDAAGVAVILIERPPATAEWAGLRDRLSRAAQT